MGPHHIVVDKDYPLIHIYSLFSNDTITVNYPAYISLFYSPLDSTKLYYLTLNKTSASLKNNTFSIYNDSIMLAKFIDSSQINNTIIGFKRLNISGFNLLH